MSTPEQHHWPCEACGADLAFSPGQRHLTCGHCGHEQDIPEAPRPDKARALQELDLHAALADALPASATEEVRLVRCPSCGAETEFDGVTHAASCPFCASPVVTDTGTERHFKPQALIPFQLAESEARAAMGRWLKGLWFAPSGLKQYARQERGMDGIYVPWWTFDAATRSRYSGQRGTYYYETRTRTVTVNGKRQTRNEQVRKVRWTPVSGRVARFFDDVLVLASRSLPRRYTDALAPWGLEALTPYRPDFLSGFRAEGYTVPLDEGHGLARQQMETMIHADVRRAIGGDEQRIGSVHTIYSDETFKHILLPVWMAAYRYRGKSYRFVVNGQSGKVRGERPWSVWKIGFAVLVAAALAVAVVALTEG